MAQDSSQGSPKSAAARLQVITPGGAQTRSKRASEFPENFPAILHGGLGAQVFGPDRMYTDWICGLGAVSLGYGYRPVTEAVFRAINEGGPSYSLPHRLELETSELLIDTLRSHGLPNVDQVRWVKTGSEGTLAAMMIARAATRRELIISIGYHGWHEAHAENNRLWTAKYAEIRRVAQIFDKHLYPKVAAVLVEPVRDESPPEGYLQEIRRLCTKHGALLIFDECVTGFRWAIGGASEYFGVEPDLAVFGKGMANGYPLAGVVGRTKYMRFADGVSGTFGGETVALAAAGATIREFRERDVIGHFREIGTEWLDSGEAKGYAYHPRLRGTPEEVFRKTRLLASAGVLVHPKGFNISFSHTKDDVKRAVQALKGVYELCEHCQNGVPHHTVGTGGIGSPYRYTTWDLHEVSDASGVGLAECRAAHLYDKKLQP